MEPIDWTSPAGAVVMVLWAIVLLRAIGRMLHRKRLALQQERDAAYCAPAPPPYPYETYSYDPPAHVGQDGDDASCR